MGRYYSGDINGKFAFGIQSSYTADRFGVYGSEPNYIEYYFTVDDLETLQEELKSIEEELGVNLKKIEDYYYNENLSIEEDLNQYLGLEEEKVNYYLKEYFDYELGKKIKKSILENGECLFQAEL
jgi:predicted solute-binding protein